MTVAGPRARHPVLRRPLLGTALLCLATWALAGCGEGPDPLTDDALANGTYLTGATAGGTVTLLEGEADLPPGSELERIELVSSARGDLDADGETDAAVVLVEEEGRSRILRLHAVLRLEDEARDVASRMLGDGVIVEELSIADGIITTALRVHARGQPPTSEPSERAALQFALTDRGLVPIVLPAIVDEGDARSASDPPTLISHEWIMTGLEWEGETWSGEEGRTRPALAFVREIDLPEGVAGRIAGEGGCNRLFAGFESRGGEEIRIHGIATTRRMCRSGPRELEARLVEALRAADSYEIVGQELRLRSGDAADGVVRFEPGGALVPTASPDSGSAAEEVAGTGSRT